MDLGHPLFSAWRDFYELVGTASATLVGLMFVAASVGRGVFTQQRQSGLRAFLSPTVVAFSVVLATSLIAVAPSSHWQVPSVVLVSMGIFGVLYSWRVRRQMVREGITKSIDLEDQAWYTVVPALAYLIILVSGSLLGAYDAVACATLAVGVCLLLLAGIRNAWDMTTWVVLRPH